MRTPVAPVALLTALAWLTIGCAGIVIPDWFGEKTEATAVPTATQTPFASPTPVPTMTSPPIPSLTPVPTATNPPIPSATPGPSDDGGKSSAGPTAPPPPTQAAPDVTVAVPDHVVAVVVLAQVVAVDIVVAESNPPQYFAQIVSGLSNSCVEDHGYELSYEGYSIAIKTYSLEPGPAAQVVCAAVYREQETSVPLGSDFESGQRYTLKANDKEITFVAQ